MWIIQYIDQIIGFAVGVWFTVLGYSSQYGIRPGNDPRRAVLIKRLFRIIGPLLAALSLILAAGKYYTSQAMPGPANLADAVPDRLRELRLSVGLNQTEDGIVDPMVIDDFGSEERCQLACNRHCFSHIFETGSALAVIASGA